jgi:uncharacterized membrane protein (UPF0127 family)
MNSAKSPSTATDYRKFAWIIYLFLPLLMQPFRNPDKFVDKTAPLVLPVTGQLRVGNKAVQLEVANTPSAIERGLTHRVSMPRNRGLMYATNRDVILTTFSGKGNKFDTDLIYIKNETVVDLQRVVACSQSKCLEYRTDKDFDRVIEVNAGVVNELGIDVGTKVKVDILPR